MRAMKSKWLWDSELATIEALSKSINESSLQMGNVAHASNNDALVVNRAEELT